MPHGRPMPETHRLSSTSDECIFAEHSAAGFWADWGLAQANGGDLWSNVWMLWVKQVRIQASNMSTG